MSLHNASASKMAPSSRAASTSANPAKGKKAGLLRTCPTKKPRSPFRHNQALLEGTGSTGRLAGATRVFAFVVFVKLGFLVGSREGRPVNSLAAWLFLALRYPSPQIKQLLNSFPPTLKAVEGLRPSFSAHVSRISCPGWW